MQYSSGIGIRVINYVCTMAMTDAYANGPISEWSQLFNPNSFNSANVCKPNSPKCDRLVRFCHVEWDDAKRLEVYALSADLLANAIVRNGTHVNGTMS